MSVDYAQDLAGLYADFGEAVTIGGLPITAIFSGGFVETNGIVGTQPALRCRAADVAGVALGAAVLRAGVSYVVRERQALPPDELETLLILERA